MTTIETKNEHLPKRSMEQAAREDADNLLDQYRRVVEGLDNEMSATFVPGPHDLIHEYWLEGLGVNLDDLPTLDLNNKDPENMEFTLNLVETEFTFNLVDTEMKCSILVQPDGTPHTFIYHIQNNC